MEQIKYRGCIIEKKGDKYISLGSEFTKLSDAQDNIDAAWKSFNQNKKIR